MEIKRGQSHFTNKYSIKRNIFFNLFFAEPTTGFHKITDIACHDA